MKKIYLIVLALLSFSCVASNSNNENLYGSYVYKSGDAQYEEFALMPDHEFRSWLHHRPASKGTWSLKDNAIHIKDSLGEIKMKVIKVDKKEAVFRFDDTKTPAVFEKVE